MKNPIVMAILTLLFTGAVAFAGAPEEQGKCECPAPQEQGKQEEQQQGQQQQGQQQQQQGKENVRERSKPSRRYYRDNSVPCADLIHGSDVGDFWDCMNQNSGS